MNNWRERLNLFYYNIFRFERYTQYLVSHPMHVFVKFVGLGSTMAKRSGREDWDDYILSVLNDPKGGMSLHFAGLQVSLLVFLLLFTPWNIFCGLVQIGIVPWSYGLVVPGILALILSEYAAPGDARKYLKDFKRFETMPKAWKCKSALLTLLVVIGTWTAFLASFVFYIKSLIQSTGN